MREDRGSDNDPGLLDSVEPPELGPAACSRRRTSPSRATRPRPSTATEKHTAETFAIGDLPRELQDEDYESAKLGAFAYETCGSKFETFLGADESLVMRTVVSWAWFSPSEKAWDKGARWYRCDVVGGGEQSKRFVDLPRRREACSRGGRRTSGWCA